MKLATSRMQLPARTHPSDTKIESVRRSLSLLLLFVAGVCFWNGLPDRLADDARQAVVADARAAVRAPQAVPETGDVSLNTTPIQDIRVGQRVQAHNPEVSAKERESWDEPDWSQWQLVRLEMPKPDGSLLEIEMLRPQEWLDSQAALVVETREVIAHPGPLDVQEPSAESQESGPSVTSPNQLSESGSALGEESPDQADATEPRATESLDSGPSSLDSFQPIPLVPESVPVGLVVEMDLPELGLTDLAWVTDIADCPEIESRDSGRSAGGSVVTATFHHSSGDVIDLVVEDEGVSQPSPFRPHPSKETIGTTSNHPFWSVDRQEYVQAGQLEPGERVLTFSGDTKRIASKLARPGPQPVYNLEVHAEHVYFVGEDGLLVHNNCANSGAASRRAYLNAKFGRSGNLNVDINVRGVASQVKGLDAASRKLLTQSAISGKSVVIIGERMSRVQNFARTLRTHGFTAKTYSPRNFTGLTRKALEANRSWLRYWAVEKRLGVLDIGIEVGGRRSRFYITEWNSLYKNWKYGNVGSVSPGY